MRSQLWVLDTHSLIYRAMHMRNGTPTVARDGRSTKGVNKFVRLLVDLLDAHDPDYLVAALDVPRHTTFRRAMYPDYKKGRGNKTRDADIKHQVNMCVDVLHAFGIPSIKVEGFEADDVIASIVDVCAGPNTECVVVTRDKDLYQLVSDDCMIYDHHTGSFIKEPEVIKRWGVKPSDFVEFQTLTGDSRDNVPGVSQFGDTRARIYIKKYGTVATMCDNLDELPSWASKALTEADLTMCRQLVELRTDVPLSISADRMAYDGLDYDRAKPILKCLGINI